jgi:hypothetical protein
MGTTRESQRETELAPCQNSSGLANIPGIRVPVRTRRVPLDKGMRQPSEWRLESAVTQREVRGGSDARSAAASAPVAASASDIADAVRDSVISAFVLGWHMAELFHAKVPRSSQHRQATLGKLVGIGELDPLAQARLLLAQVQADVRRTWWLDDSGHPLPDPSPVQSLLDAELRQPGQLQAAVAELHRQLLVALTAADFRLGKAYGLGRALAETALLPDAKNPQTFQTMFARYRLANLLGWLADLKSVFPPHAAEAVRGSLQSWAAWSEAPSLRPVLDDLRPAPDAEVDGQAPGPAPTSPRAVPAPATRRTISGTWFSRHRSEPHPRPVDWGSTADRESVTRALRRQGQLWRAILSGEKDGLDLLSADDYMWAADQLLGHLRRLTLGFLRRFWITTTAVALILVAAIVTVLAVRAVSTTVAAALTAAGAIGLTWKGAASGLGRVLGQAQRPLWDSELDVAVANALTRMPRERRASDRPPAAEGALKRPDGAAANAGDAEELVQE